MFGRVSPKLSMLQAANMKKKGLSPKISEKKKVSPKVGRSRASWNAGLEKVLVQLLHEHNNECYRGQNGWSSEAWNRIVRLFHDKFPYVSFTKAQIQEKEKELKRDYRVLKEARKQSGVHWNEQLCRIEAEELIWNNIITSYERAKKFRSKSFPLFEALGELYDGQTAEGTLNFTSIDPSQAVAATRQAVAFTQTAGAATQVTATTRQAAAATQYVAATQDIAATQATAVATQATAAATQSATAAAAATPAIRGAAATQERFSQGFGFTQLSEENIEDLTNVQPGEDDEEVRVLDQPPAPNSSMSSRGKKAAGSKNDKDGIAGQKRGRDGQVVDMMARFLEMKEKQAENEAEERARSSATVDNFSIPMCIAVVDQMQELSDDEKVDAYGVLKDAQNRAIFMSAKESTRIKWLRKEIGRA